MLYHAAGGTGVGMLDACDEAGIMSIGVDQDQSLVRPNDKAIITSALKKVDEAVIAVSKGIIDGSIKGGENQTLGAAEDAVGIAETHDRLPDDIYNAALEVLEKIKKGDIVVPATKADLAKYIQSL